MKNLLKETILSLNIHNKTPNDVLFVCGLADFDSSDPYNYKKYKFGHETWDDFARWANQDYDEGYGTEEVNMSLEIVGKDFWLERHSYDGSEWWEFKTIPKIEDYPIKTNRLIHFGEDNEE